MSYRPTIKQLIRAVCESESSKDVLVATCIGEQREETIWYIDSFKLIEQLDLIEEDNDLYE